MRIEKNVYKKIYNKYKRKDKFRNFRTSKIGFVVTVAIGSTLGFIIGSYSSKNLVLSIVAGFALIVVMFLIIKLSIKNFEKLYKFQDYQKLAIISDHQPIATDYFPFIHLVKKYLKREDVILWSNIITSFFQEKKLVLTKTDFIAIMKLILNDPQVDQVYRQYIPKSLMITEDQYQKLLNHLPEGNIIQWNTFYGWESSPSFSTSPVLYRTDTFLKEREVYDQAWKRILHEYPNPESLSKEMESQYNEDLKTVNHSLEDHNSNILFLLNIASEDRNISKDLDLPVAERYEKHKKGEITYHEAYFKPSIRAREIVQGYIIEIKNPINCIYPFIGKTEGWTQTISNEEYLELAE